MADQPGPLVEAAGPAARLWRNVYRKAAEAAEARLGALLRDHVYLFHRDMGTGGGGGGMVELGRAVATAGQLDLRVPTSGALATGYGALQLVASGRNNGASGNRDVWLFYNDDVSLPPYNFSAVQGNPSTGAVITEASDFSFAIRLGYAPAVDGAHPGRAFGLSGTVPLHGATGLPKYAHLVSGYLASPFVNPLPRHTTGIYAPSGLGPITSVTLRCLSPGWLTGATLIVYGYPNAP
jgi:hypothetical protein